MTFDQWLALWIVIPCAAFVAGMVGVGIASSIERSRRESASPHREAHHEGAEGARADLRDAPAALRRLPAPGHDRDALAGRAPSASLAGRADHDRELRPLAHVVPMVRASLQPVSRGSARRAADELAARRHEPSLAGAPALVRAMHAWGCAGLVVADRAEVL
ncbi:hypothetical protein [Agrococcus sp. TF02-05]|uniref:hypothetical protein n=1 Tax=Agrococcus sp. TF02-05 TaxID=2815211 RepID=UPI001AA0B2FE|nr:hypothetical protein [Agrococcus sp. TF02-05]MBO1770465.1 hypothetical protein [Agrococcus sp. TF02-05]